MSTIIIDTKKEFSVEVWHKDGIVPALNGYEGRVYRNGALADTGGKWEHIVLVKRKHVVKYFFGKLFKLIRNK